MLCEPLNKEILLVQRRNYWLYFAGSPWRVEVQSASKVGVTGSGIRQVHVGRVANVDVTGCKTPASVNVLCESHFLTVWRTKLANFLETSGRLFFFISAHFRFVAAIQQHSASRFVCSWGLSGVMVTPTISYFNFASNPSGSLIPRV